MAITCGMIKEFLFISKVSKTPVSVSLKTNFSKEPIHFSIIDGFLDVFYSGVNIWRESLEEATTMFGIESVSTISEIIFMIDNGNDSWKSRVYCDKA
jgi:hypothetical protein